MYEIRLQDAAIRELGRLDTAVGRRIVNRIRWLAQNVNDIKPEGLTGELAGFYKLRVGDYRVIYEILLSEQTLVIHLIGHRREIYRSR